MRSRWSVMGTSRRGERIIFPRLILMPPSLSDYYYITLCVCFSGPNFDYTYYITVTGIVGSLMNLFSVVLYQRVFSGWRFRPAIILTLVVGGLASMVDLIIIMRWNIDIGIPDKIFFMFGILFLPKGTQSLEVLLVRFNPYLFRPSTQRFAPPAWNRLYLVSIIFICPSTYES